MKKVLFIMAAALMTMTQCRKQETMPAAPAADTIKMTITAGSGAKTDINTETGSITWSAGDKLYVSDGTSWLGSLTLIGDGGSSQGLFTGNVAIGGGTTPCHFFYLGHDNGMEEPTAGTGTDAVISLASQDGTLAGAMKYHIGYGTTDVTVESGECEGYVLMNTKIAIAHINFTTDGTTAYTGSVTMGGTGVSNTLSVSPAGIFSGGGEGGIAIDKGDGTTGERFVTLIPTGETSIFVAFTGDATGSMAFANGIVENKFYGMKDAIAVTLEAAGPTHEYVDLGLSVKWATCNVGADSPEKYGDYFQWGGVTPVTSTSINVSWAGCPFTNGTYSTINKNVFTKYVPTGKTEYWAGSGDPDNKLVLDPEDDAASANWGGDWRMPTSAEWQELNDNTTSTWTDNYNNTGVKGRVFTSNKEGYTGKSIFLPAAGDREETSLNSAGSYGNYWSGSLYLSTPRNACYIYFYSDEFDPNDYNFRCYGLSVRPVR